MVTIRFENVSKRYRIQRGHRTLGGWLTTSLERVLPGRRPGPVVRSEEFWALRDVTFEVRRGEAFGIIGPNGSGKTTTLKLLSRITHPTHGAVQVTGRVGALLEVGAGFHDEMSGRENVYLNAAILGMKKGEIERKFASIVEFAELEQFIDTPIKKYSTGMRMRLGFAVAAHIQPDVLLIDEVLAVGDVSFRQKCLRCIREMKDAGTSIVFVSHDLSVVRKLCDRALFIYRGEAQALGQTESVIQSYYESLLRPAFERMVPAPRRVEAAAPKEAEILGVRFLGSDGAERVEFRTGENLVVAIDYVARRRIEEPSFGLSFHGVDGTLYGSVVSALEGYRIDVIEGPGTMLAEFPSLPLMPNIFEVSAVIADRTGFSRYDWHDREYRLLVLQGRGDQGITYLPHRWHVNGYPSEARATHPDEAVDPEGGREGKNVPARAAER